ELLDDLERIDVDVERMRDSLREVPDRPLFNRVQTHERAYIAVKLLSVDLVNRGRIFRRAGGIELLRNRVEVDELRAADFVRLNVAQEVEERRRGREEIHRRRRSLAGNVDRQQREQRTEAVRIDGVVHLNGNGAVRAVTGIGRFDEDVRAIARREQETLVLTREVVDGFELHAILR